MKRILSLFILITLFGCSHDHFFDFDEIEYYHSDISMEQISPMYKDENKSEYAERFLNVVEEDYPNNVDENFSKILKEIGYKKVTVRKEKYAEINKIFSEQTCFSRVETSCIPVYRDILIFKKEKRTIGIAKICFQCLQSHIVGTEKDVFDFGQCGDFENLKKLLK